MGADPAAFRRSERAGPRRRHSRSHGPFRRTYLADLRDLMGDPDTNVAAHAYAAELALKLMTPKRSAGSSWIPGRQPCRGRADAADDYRCGRSAGQRSRTAGGTRRPARHGISKVQADFPAIYAIERCRVRVLDAAPAADILVGLLSNRRTKAQEPDRDGPDHDCTRPPRRRCGDPTGPHRVARWNRLDAASGIGLRARGPGAAAAAALPALKTLAAANVPGGPESDFAVRLIECFSVARRRSSRQSSPIPNRVSSSPVLAHLCGIPR